jgi:hypothetical protein
MYSYSFSIGRYKGVYEYCKSKRIDLGKPVGLDVVVDGSVPQGTIQWLISLFLFNRVSK